MTSGDIDAHQHFWAYRPADFPWIGKGSGLDRDFAPQDVRDDLSACGIVGTVAVEARQSEAETRRLLDLAADDDGIVGVVGWVDLMASDLADRLEALACEPKLVGFRHHVQDEPDPDFLRNPVFRRGVRQVLEAGYAYDLLIHAAQLAEVPAFLDAVGPGTLIIDHGAKPLIAPDAWEPWASLIAQVASTYPVFCKLSGLVTQVQRRDGRSDGNEPPILRYMKHLLRCFGPTRLIYGSDWPVCNLAASYREVHALALRLMEPLDRGDRDAIMGGNARRAYRLEPASRHNDPSIYRETAPGGAS